MNNSIVSNCSNDRAAALDIVEHLLSSNVIRLGVEAVNSAVAARAFKAAIAKLWG
jgi:hypothetical protein